MLTREEPYAGEEMAAAEAKQPAKTTEAMKAKEDIQENQRTKTGPAETDIKTPINVPQAETWEPARSRKGLTILVIAVVVLALLGGGFYYCWMNYSDLFGIPMGASDRRLSIRNLEGQEIVTKEGSVFLVSGNVFNGSTKPRRFLILRAKLFDKEGKVVAEKDVVSGLALAKEKIGAMQKTEIEKKVNDFKLSSEENFQVGSKNQVPFSVIFFDSTIEKAKEFTVEIVESPVL